MAVAYTSSLAYASLHGLGDKQWQVLCKIEELQPCSNLTIAASLGWEINRVTGRVNELAKKGLIKSESTARNGNGRLEKLWQISEKEKKGVENGTNADKSNQRNEQSTKTT